MVLPTECDKSNANPNPSPQCHSFPRLAARKPPLQKAVAFVLFQNGPNLPALQRNYNPIALARLVQRRDPNAVGLAIIALDSAAILGGLARSSR